jgi:hypothetical protein
MLFWMDKLDLQFLTVPLSRAIYVIDLYDYYLNGTVGGCLESLD